MDENRIWTAALLGDRRRDFVGADPGQECRAGRDLAQREGIGLAEVRIVPEYRAHRRGGQCAPRGHDYLFTTGGIGPTHDDITVDAIAEAFGVPVVVHPQARAILEDYYRDRPGGLNEARLRMARVPEGAELIANPSSGAPGRQARQRLSSSPACRTSRRACWKR